MDLQGPGRNDPTQAAKIGYTKVEIYPNGPHETPIYCDVYDPTPQKELSKRNSVVQ